MPKVRAERLREIGRAALPVANGVPDAEAATVARHGVGAEPGDSAGAAGLSVQLGFAQGVPRAWP